MANILIIDGHPDPQSFCSALVDAYSEGVRAGAHNLSVIHVRDLKFDPNLRYGYSKRMELERDLLKSQELIKEADHIVWVYPVWWGSYPAILKGFIDRVFLPGFAFTKKENSLLWNKLLTGKSARIISTMDQPSWYYRLVYSSPSHNAMKRGTMNFIGVKRVKISSIGPVRNSTVTFRKKWLNKINKLGRLAQ